MNKVMSEVLFNRAILWVLVGHMATSTPTRVLAYVCAVCALINSFAKAVSGD